MPKRLTDTLKWNDPWFCSLLPKEKLLWVYILDNCDHAGVWAANWSMVKFHIGEIPNLDKFLSRAIKVSEEKLFFPKFLVFQYGKDWHRSKIKAHKSAVNILKQLGLYERALTLTQPLPNPYPTLTQPLPKPYGYGNGNGNGNGSGSGYGSGKMPGRVSCKK